MKTLSIGDIHGMNVLSEIKLVDKVEQYDKIIFVGDYVDSFNIDNLTMIDTLKQIINYKIENPDKVILLLGNHDIQYLLGYSKYGCSGYRAEISSDLYTIFNENRDLFQVAYQYDNYIWTHAGIHQGWFEFSFKGDIDENIADQLNKEDWYKNQSLFDVGHIRGGYKNVGGPFWCDKTELRSAPLKGYNQIVGHTTNKYNIEKEYVKNCELVFIDILQTEIKFYNKEFKIKENE
jgi:predicted MPP superfamily phosphohydrolase